jgi:hypothetical protein
MELLSSPCGEPYVRCSAFTPIAALRCWHSPSRRCSQHCQCAFCQTGCSGALSRKQDFRCLRCGRVLAAAAGLSQPRRGAFRCSGGGALNTLRSARRDPLLHVTPVVIRGAGIRRRSHDRADHTADEAEYVAGAERIGGRRRRSRCDQGEHNRRGDRASASEKGLGRRHYRAARNTAFGEATVNRRQWFPPARQRGQSRLKA